MVDRANGYDLEKPGATRIGYIRFNVGGETPGKYRIYVYEPFNDPRGMFDNESTGNGRGRGWTCVAGPGDEDAIRYVISVLESSYDQK